MTKQWKWQSRQMPFCLSAVSVVVGERSRLLRGNAEKLLAIQGEMYRTMTSPNPNWLNNRKRRWIFSRKSRQQGFTKKELKMWVKREQSGDRSFGPDNPWEMRQEVDGNQVEPT
jgi:hypothetical protein